VTTPIPPSQRSITTGALEIDYLAEAGIGTGPIPAPYRSVPWAYS
jgi:hypothetical protein